MANDAVAMVSSCAHLPWMMDVNSLRVCASTAFHTLLTHGHVVSTMFTPLSLSSFISCTDAPNAGRMTTSPSWHPLKSFPASVSSMNWTPISPRRSLTVGLWMISLVIQRLESGNCLRASYAICTARSTPQQKP